MKTKKQTIKLDVNDPREALAASTFLLGKAPHNSLVLLPQGKDSSLNLPTARFPLPNFQSSDYQVEVISEAELLRSTIHLIIDLLNSGAKSCLFLFSLGCQGASYATAAKVKVNDAERQNLEKFAWGLMRAVEAIAQEREEFDYLSPFGIFQILHAGEAKCINIFDETPLGEGYKPIGNIFESNFAANLVAKGERLELLQVEDFIPDELAGKTLKQLVNSDLCYLTEKEFRQGVDIPQVFKSIIASGAAAPKWLHVESEAELVKKYELLQKLLTAVVSNYGRDQILTEVFELTTGISAQIQDVVNHLLEDDELIPGNTIHPGGKAYSLLNQWAELWNWSVEEGLDENMVRELGKLASISALFIWWSGKFAESFELSRKLVLVDPNNHMAQLVQDLSNSKFKPKWFQKVALNLS